MYVHSPLSLAQDKLAELELQQANLHELLAALKDPKNAAAKLTEWHAKLGEARSTITSI